MKRSFETYPEDLLTPLHDDGHEALRAARASKMTRLLEHYGLRNDDPERWEHLSQILSCEFIPGFKVRTRRGRPPLVPGSVPPGTPSEFVAQRRLVPIIQKILVVQQERERGIADAVRIARHRHPELRAYKQSTLETGYREWERRCEEFYREMMIEAEAAALRGDVPPVPPPAPRHEGA